MNKIDLITAPDVVNLNVTSALLQTLQQTKDMWSSLMERDGLNMQPITM